MVIGKDLRWPCRKSYRLTCEQRREARSFGINESRGAASRTRKSCGPQDGAVHGASASSRHADDFDCCVVKWAVNHEFRSPSMDATAAASYGLPLTRHGGAQQELPRPSAMKAAADLDRDGVTDAAVVDFDAIATIRLPSDDRNGAGAHGVTS